MTEKDTAPLNKFVTYKRIRNGKEQTVTRRVRANEVGWSRTPLYKVWNGMKRRCHEPQAQNYRWYGGRGITVCEEWRHDFLTFRTWAENNGYEKGMELDRINNDLGYNPDNCRWLTKLDNLANRRGYLQEEIQVALKELAEERNVSITALIQEAVVAYFGFNQGEGVISDVS